MEKGVGAIPTPTLTISLNTIDMRTQQTTFTCQVTYTSSEPSINFIILSLNIVGGNTVSNMLWVNGSNPVLFNSNKNRTNITVR